MPKVGLSVFPAPPPDMLAAARVALLVVAYQREAFDDLAFRDALSWHSQHQLDCKAN